jgi:hypothetical protein
MKPIRLLTAREIYDLAPPPWRIARLLPQQCLAVLYGLPKTLKSFVAIDWALSTSRGEDWLGHATEQCDVVYVVAEGVGGFSRRLGAWLGKRKLTVDDIPRFRGVAQPVNVTAADDVGQLVGAIRGSGLERPGLIVLDTVSRCFGGGDTNQQQDMSLFVKGCDDLRDAFGATVLAVHHCAKSGGGDWPLGSVALPGAADAMFLTERPSQHSPQLTLRNTAQKDADEHRDIHLRLEQEGDSCVLAPDSEPETKQGKAPRTKPEEATYLALLPFGGEGATHADWQAASNRAPRTFNTHIKKLLEAKRVSQNGKRYSCVVGADDPVLEGER